MAMHPVAVAVLAGGRASRMGEPKQHVRMPDGRTMGVHVVDCCSTLTHCIVIAGPEGSMDGHTCIADHPAWHDCGPLAGIEAVLASGLADRWLIVPCDMPHLTRDVLQTMLDHKGPGAVVLEGAGPFPMRIDTTMLNQVRTALNAGALAVRDLPCIVEAHGIPVADHRIVQDIDRPDDLPH